MRTFPPFGSNNTGRIQVKNICKPIKSVSKSDWMDFEDTGDLHEHPLIKKFHFLEVQENDTQFTWGIL